MKPLEAGRKFYLLLAHEIDVYLPRRGAIELAVGGPGDFPEEDIILLAEALIVNGSTQAGLLTTTQESLKSLTHKVSGGGQIIDLREDDDIPEIDDTTMSTNGTIFLRRTSQSRMKCNTIFFDRADGKTFEAITMAFVNLIKDLEYNSQAIELPLRFTLHGFNAVLREFSLIGSEEGANISLERFAAAVSADWTYIGAQVSSDKVLNWINQFPAHGRDGALDVLKYLNAEGYYSTREIADTLLKLLKRQSSTAQLVAIQRPGKSEGMLIYEMRMADRVVDFDTALKGVSGQLISVDDVIGSGDTMLDCIFRPGPVVDKWLEEDGNSILVIAAFASSDGIAKIESDPRCKGKVKVLAGTVMELGEGIFADGADIFRNEGVKDQFKSVCLSVGDHIFGGAPLGWGDCGWAVVTGYNVPDCTLPIIWGDCEQPTWKSLFARR